MNKHSAERYKRPLVVSAVIVVFGLLGLSLIFLTRASTPTASVESENGTLSGITQLNDTSASGGKAIRFNTPTSSPGSTLLGAGTYGSTSGVRLGWADFQAQMQGDLKARRSYLDPSTTIPTSFASSNAAQDIANNDMTFFSMKLDPSAFPAGTMDAAFNKFLNSIPAGHQTYLSYFHEPEDDIVKGTVIGSTALTLANWKASVNHMGQLIHATGRPELHNMVILQGPWTFYSGGYGGTEYWDSGFAANVDAIGIDPYNTNGKWTDIPNMSGTTQMMSWIHQHNKPFGITEIGAHEPTLSAAADQGKADWISRQWAWAKANNAICFLYFNINATSGLPDSESNIIASGSPAETAFRAMVREANGN